MAETAHQMVIDHAGRLHEGVDDGRADKLEAASSQLLGDLDRDRRRGWHAGGGLELVQLRLAVDEIPQELREARAVFHDFQIRFRAGDRALDLGAIADDADVIHQCVNLPGVVARDLLGTEIVKGAAKILALAQDREPGQPGLEAVKDQLFVQRAVVIFRHAPFIVVIGHVKRIFAWPRAPRQPIFMQARRPCHATVCFDAVKASGSATRIASPPELRAVPAASASATRSILTSARPAPAADEPIVPTALSPATMGEPASGAGPSSTTRTVR